jgi:hypothetical protein
MGAKYTQGLKFPLEAPFYAPELCPVEDPTENLKWRIHLREAARKDEGLQRDLRQACFEDLLFFFSFCCYCFEPRAKVKVKPFCLWPHQEPAFLAMDGAIDQSEEKEEPVDVVVDKSRGQGATWGYLLIILRRWLRDEMFSAGLVTRNEKLVDSARDPDTLMWKLVWAINRLPIWLLPEGLDLSKHRNLAEHSLLNPENGASIVGYSATGDVARGGRKTVFALDELAAFRSGEDYHAMDSTQHVTNCRFLVSTYLGDSGAYYESAALPNDAIKVVLDWRDNPTQNQCMYRVVEGESFRVDGKRFPPHIERTIKEQHAKLRRRGFKLEGKLRSVWYNSQCLRPGATPRGIAQELDRDPHGSVSKVFDSEVTKKARAEFGRDPLAQGRFMYSAEQAEPTAPYLAESEGEGGDLRLWKPRGLDGSIPISSYVMGVDISAGTSGSYSSNSVACVVDRMTGEQVAELVTNRLVPGKFAVACVALARWFHNAEIIPEANFGAGFMKTVVEELNYPHMFYRGVEIVGSHKKTKKPGFWMTNDDVKLRLFEALQIAISERAFIPRSLPLLDEMPQYEWKNGHIIHVGSTKTDDEGGKGKAHGDRVIAAALAWEAMQESPVLSDPEGSGEVGIPRTPGTMSERLGEYDDSLGNLGDPWLEPELDIFPQECHHFDDTLSF